MLFNRMSIFKTTYQKLSCTAGLLLLLLTSCSAGADGEDLTTAPSTSNYINFTLYVSSSENGITRSPVGGEDGDGREAGFQRENQVTGVTVILYKGTGLDDASATVDFVRYFTVTEDNLEGRDSQGTTYSYAAADTYRAEARYTTGDQKLEKDELDFTGTYHVLIVANQDLTSTCAKGTLISTVRDMTTADVYTNATPATPHTAGQFIMTTERDATINFASMAPVAKTDVANSVVYRVNQPMLIERLSARIDYNTKGSTYVSEKAGYQYDITGSTDKFVVTKVTPFNLYNGSEYLVKRVQDAWPTTATTYLGDETTTNYVADPNTASKDNTSALSYLSPIAESMSTTYAQVMNNINEAAKFTDANSNLNIIIAYPKENTLMPTSKLKMYATGLAFGIDYYTGGTGTPEHRVYYYFLRHQGEASATNTYNASKWADITGDETCGSTPMNYGIVRNNIYRVDVAGMTPDAKLQLNIKVKKWDEFEHDPIYM